MVGDEYRRTSHCGICGQPLLRTWAHALCARCQRHISSLARRQRSGSPRPPKAVTRAVPSGDGLRLIAMGVAVSVVAAALLGIALLAGR